MDGLVIEWDGREVPEELRKLPPGRYVIAPEEAPLTPEEDEGIRAALDDLDAGQGLEWSDVLRDLRGGSSR